MFKLHQTLNCVISGNGLWNQNQSKPVVSQVFGTYGHSSSWFRTPPIPHFISISTLGSAPRVQHWAHGLLPTIITHFGILSSVFCHLLFVYLSWCFSTEIKIIMWKSIVGNFWAQNSRNPLQVCPNTCLVHGTCSSSQWRQFGLCFTWTCLESEKPDDLGCGSVVSAWFADVTALCSH